MTKPMGGNGEPETDLCIAGNLQMSQGSVDKSIMELIQLIRYMVGGKWIFCFTS